MKKFLFAASAIGLLAASPAFAQSSNTVSLSGTVAKACGVGNHISGSGTASGWTAGNVSGIVLTDGNGQFNTPVDIANRSFGNLWCNAPANVSIEVTPFATTNSTLDTGSFRNSFEVQITTRAVVYTGATDAPTVLSSNNAPTTGNSGQAFETGTGAYGGASLIRIVPAARSGGGNYRPVAGDYTGSVKITATVS